MVGWNVLWIVYVRRRWSTFHIIKRRTSLILWPFSLRRKGYADTEIEALFAKYDTDGDRILDPEEQKCLAEDLLRQKDSLNAEYAKIQKDAAEGEPPAALADLMVSDGGNGDNVRIWLIIVQGWL